MLDEKDRGQLGGMRGAKYMTPEERYQRARRAGKQTLANRGREFYVRLAMRRWGKKVELDVPNPQIEKPRKRRLARSKVKADD